MEAAAVVTDYGDAVLIDKGLVHALNHDIKKLAREKIQILKEIRDFRRGIVQHEWERERAEVRATSRDTAEILPRCVQQPVPRELHFLLFRLRTL